MTEEIFRVSYQPATPRPGVAERRAGAVSQCPQRRWWNVTGLFKATPEVVKIRVAVGHPIRVSTDRLGEVAR